MCSVGCGVSLSVSMSVTFGRQSFLSYAFIFCSFLSLILQTFGHNVRHAKRTLGAAQEAVLK